MSRVLPALLLSLACVSFAGAAGANMAASTRDPAQVSAPAIARPTKLRVESEQLSFVCAEEQGKPRCTFEARYQVQNPELAAEEVAVAFYGVRAHGVRVLVDGVAPSVAPEAELNAIDKALEGLP